MIDDFSGDFAFLSNFFPVDVTFEGLLFRSTEAAYQASKTLDLRLRRQFVLLSPVKAKKLGNKIELRDDWTDVRLQIMENILRQKFAIEEFKELLLLTGDEELVEGNVWHDVFWGVCNGVGENHLGKLLMKIRLEIACDKQ
jgi:ribA/ribD-fused uncharacterized protein